MRKLRQLLKEASDGAADGAVEVCKQLQTCEMRAQALNTLVTSRRTPSQTLLDIVEGFMHTLEANSPSGLCFFAKGFFSFIYVLLNTALCYYSIVVIYVLNLGNYESMF